MIVLILCIISLLGICCEGAVSPRCTKTMAAGRCRARIMRFYYDANTGACAPFTYTGCGGNDNRFATLTACQRTCDLAHVCSLPADQGKPQCRAKKPRYFYNPQTARCEFFFYTGCGGNRNNFNTPKDCYVTCLQNGATTERIKTGTGFLSNIFGRK